MTDKLALVGEVVGEVDPRDLVIAKLEREAQALRRQVSDAETRASRAREDADRAMTMLRRALSPLYRSLQAVFGELDNAGVTDDGPASSPTTGSGVAVGTADPRVQAVWTAWKEKLPPACGKVIDALLIHGDLNQAQIKVAAKLGTSTVSDAVYKLNKAGLINKNGGRVSLKGL